MQRLHVFPARRRTHALRPPHSAIHTGPSHCPDTHLLNRPIVLPTYITYKHFTQYTLQYYSPGDDTVGLDIYLDEQPLSSWFVSAHGNTPRYTRTPTRTSTRNTLHLEAYVLHTCAALRYDGIPHATRRHCITFHSHAGENCADRLVFTRHTHDIALDAHHTAV